MADPTPHDLRGTAVPAGEDVPCPWDVEEQAQPYEPPPSFVAATERYAANMRDAGLEVTVTKHSPGHVTVSGRNPNASCGCCELGEYSAVRDVGDVSCPDCGHSPEEHG